LPEFEGGLNLTEQGEGPIDERAASLGKALLCARAAEQFKARDLVLLNVSGVASFSDNFLIGSGQSSRQVQGIADNVEKTLRQSGIRPLGVEGKNEGHWILMDYGDVIVHLFYEPVRHFYDLESLWSDAERIGWEERSSPGTTVS